MTKSFPGMGNKAEMTRIEETTMPPDPTASLEPASSDREMVESQTGKCANSRHKRRNGNVT